MLKRFSKLSALLLVGVSLSGCMQSNPMGFSDEEWARLSPQQQYDARLRQSEIDAEKRRERAREKALKEENERQRKAMVALRYQNAQYGDIVQCVMQNGVVDYSSGWQNAQPVAFSLVRGEEKQLKSWSKDKRSTVTLYADMSEDGLNVNLCRFKATSDYQKGRYCATLSATTRQYGDGVSQSFDIRKYMRGTLYCSLKPVGQAPPPNVQPNLTINNIFKSLLD